MSQIDIQSPSEDENFDISSETSASETTAPTDSAKTGSVFSDFKPGISPTVAAVETFPEPPAVAPAEVSAPEPTSQPAPVESTVQGDSLRRPVGRIVLEAVLAIAVVGLGLWSWTLYADRQNLTDQLAKVNANPQALVEAQTKTLIDRVGLLMQLPAGETPTVAGVSDAAQAKRQSAFFANAANGDKVLMYVKAGEAILYRPSTNKIILVAPLTFNSAAATTTTAPIKK